MNKQDYIAKASLFFGIIGLTLMYISMLYVEPDHVEIGEIKESWSGRNVQVIGEVKSYGEGGGHVFMTVGADETIDVVVFDAEKSFSEGEEISVKGHVDIYEGELQIVADDVERK